MSTLPLNPRSERGVALIIVMLLLAVMSGLATGMAINSQVEVAMSTNEMYYAGARAAAEAGLNRAVTAILDPANKGANMLYGADNVAGTADDGDIGYLIPNFTSWPEELGVTAQYSYTVRIFDDDDNQLYPAPLLAAQVVGLGEAPQNPTINLNDRLVIRATGFGPSGTLVSVARLLESTDSTSPGTTVPSYSNPAILVNGDLLMDGQSFIVNGAQGNVHANHNLTISGTGNKPQISGTISAVNDLSAAANTAVKGQDGDAETINVPDIRVVNYAKYADYFLNADGSRTIGSPTGPACGALCDQWNHSGSGATSVWSITGNDANTGTFYADGAVTISGSPGSVNTPKALAVIATGSIDVSGSAFLSLPAPKDPANPGKFQFVTDGDLMLLGNADVNDKTSVEGRIHVREQIQIAGSTQFQGQIIVQDVRVGTLSNMVTTNKISGNAEITYEGSFDEINTPIYIPGTTSYLNNVSGWIEQ